MQTNKEGGREEDRSQVEKREPKALILGAEKKLWSGHQTRTRRKPTVFKATEPLTETYCAKTSKVRISESLPLKISPVSSDCHTRLK